MRSDVVREVKVARPHLIRASVLALIGLAGMVAAGELGQLKDVRGDEATETEKLVLYLGAAVVLVAGVLAVRAVAAAVREVTKDERGDASAAPLGLVISILGYVIVLVSVMSVFGVNPGGLLLGGAVTGVVIGIAAQQVLGNVFAGLVLVIVRPFRVGERVYLRSTVGEYEGEILDMSVFYVTIQADRGPVSLPNSAVLASAVGPGTQSSKDRPDDSPQA